MKRTIIALCVASTLLLTGANDERRARRTYERHYEHATRDLVVNNSFSSALILRGTLLTPEFRDALSSERERLLAPTTDNQAAFIQRMSDDAAAYHEVVFSADSAMPGKMLFGPGDDRWNIRLSVDGVDQPLVTVYHVRHPTPLHRGLYSHLNKWSKLYIARFSRTVDTPTEVVFHVGSGFGNGQLEWSLTR